MASAEGAVDVVVVAQGWEAGGHVQGTIGKPATVPVTWRQEARAVERDPGGGLHPGLELVLTTERARAELDSQMTQLERIRGELGRLLEQYAPPDPLEQTMAATRSLAATVEVMVRRAEHSVVACLSGARMTDAVRSGVLDLMPGLQERGVSLRLVVERSVADSPGSRALVDWLVEHEVDARSMEQPPVNLVIVDGEDAVLVPRRHVPVQSGGGAVRYHHPSVLLAVTDLFERLHRTADPWAGAGMSTTHPAGDDSRELGGTSGWTLDSPTGRAVLQLLTTGAKDDVIARNMHVSLRTFQRNLALLWDQLGAQSRLHAGVLAARRGLL